MEVNALNFILALSPILAVLILMVGFRWGGAKAGSVGWLVAFAVSLLFFGATPELLAISQGRAVLLTLYVLYIIWMALILFNVVKEAGAIEVIADGFVKLTADRVLQLLILSWVFSAFLQGVAGFGVPIAVVAPLLIGLGFSPVTAVVAVAAGHSWSVTFGDIASSFNALIAATGLSGEVLAPWAAIMLGVACFACGIVAAHALEGFTSIRHGLPAILLIGAVMAGTQYMLAVNHLWNLAGFGAGLAGLVACQGVARLPIYRRITPIELSQANRDHPVGTQQTKRNSMTFLWSITPYLILIVIVVAAELVNPLNKLLNNVNLTLMFPQTQTSYGWVVEAASGKAISVFGHPGALLAYTSILSYCLYSWSGFYKPDAIRNIISNTVRSAVLSSIGIATMVGFAMIMEQCGMTYMLALGLSQVFASLFPFVSPFIGLLGAFMTGSNTNSNVVFAGLQQQTATLLGLVVPVILAAQTTGGALGSMLAPAKIIVGCSTAGLSGEEGKVLQKTIIYGIMVTLIIGLVTWLALR